MAEAPPEPPQRFRNVYTCEQFAAEILCGNRAVKWVMAECKAKRIKWVARKPYLIPQSEAVRFVCPPPECNPPR